MTHHCFARNVGMNQGESAYHKRHQAGHCTAKLVPFGALVEYLPTPRPDTKKSAFEAKTSHGLLVGYFVQPGGKWSGDYLVADFSLLQKDLDVYDERSKPFKFLPSNLLESLEDSGW